MATTTPVYGWPYPEGFDRVNQGDDAMGALATAIESTLVPRDMSPMGADYVAATGPGAGGTMWFNSVSIARTGGMASGGTFPVFGVRVPKKGWYAITADGDMTCGGSAAGMSARLFVGDGGAAWASGSVNFLTINTNHHVSVQHVRLLNANDTVFWGMTSVGPQSAGMTGGAGNSSLLVRMLAPLP